MSNAVTQKLEQIPSAGLNRIMQVMRSLAGPYQLSAMLEEIFTAGLEVTDSELCSLWLYDDVDDTLKLHFPAVYPPVSVASGEGVAGRCLANDTTINLRNCQTDPGFNTAIDDRTGRHTRTLLSVPLVGDESSRVGVLQFLNKREDSFSQQDELLAEVLAAQCAIALQRTRMIDALVSKERLDEEVAIAREIQLSTLPEFMPSIPGYDFSGGFIPSEDTGGDLFDLVTLDDEVFILMGDATGHGFGPALSATQMQAMLRVAFRAGATLDEAYVHVNNQLVEDLPDNRFLTAFMGFLNHHDNCVRYHSAGQGPILHYHAQEPSFSWFPPTSFPVGVLELDHVDLPRQIHLAPGDILAIISDGVYEYHNRDNEQFGEDRVAAVFKNFCGANMHELKEELLASVYAFGEGAEQLDDITVVLVQRKTLQDE